MIGGALLLWWYWNKQKAAGTTAALPPVKPAADQPVYKGEPAIAGSWELNCYHQVV